MGPRTYLASLNEPPSPLSGLSISISNSQWSFLGSRPSCWTAANEEKAYFWSYYFKWTFTQVLYAQMFILLLPMEKSGKRKVRVPASKLKVVFLYYMIIILCTCTFY